MPSLHILSCSLLANLSCSDSRVLLRFIASFLAMHCAFLLDGKTWPHPQTARLTCNVVSHCGHTFLRVLLLSIDTETDRSTTSPSAAAPLHDFSVCCCTAPRLLRLLLHHSTTSPSAAALLHDFSVCCQPIQLKNRCGCVSIYTRTEN